MADLVIHDIDPELAMRLRDRAAQRGRTAGDEAAALLGQILLPGSVSRRRDEEGLGTQAARLFAGIGLAPGEELLRPPNGPGTPPRFDE